MILRSGIERKIGEIYRNQTIYINGLPNKATLQVLRESSYEEYVIDCIENGHPEDAKPLSHEKFYLVSID